MKVYEILGLAFLTGVVFLLTLFCWSATSWGITQADTFTNVVSYIGIISWVIALFGYFYWVFTKVKGILGRSDTTKEGETKP